jgi:hypothetical protein
MKKTQRLSIEFRRREVTITVRSSAPHVQGHEPDTPSTPTVCPTCGSPWITIVARMEGDAPVTPDHIHRALQQSGLHMQVSPAGQLQICRRSFEEIKEKF